MPLYLNRCCTRSRPRANHSLVFRYLRPLPFLAQGFVSVQDYKKQNDPYRVRSTVGSVISHRLLCLSPRKHRLNNFLDPDLYPLERHSPRSQQRFPFFYVNVKLSVWPLNNNLLFNLALLDTPGCLGTQDGKVHNDLLGNVKKVRLDA